ncbi:hypothetical protein tinsulaeT_25640 [Thalassotalea insulae]|uniref:Uncharacterized protein n=1 Tax=Thalassotalea insulae TaxID=2056778 RepID=A0ABQ6GVK5_9GAMM|nr:hypothetical protein [Thalassotalea insulae]GLX79224.1 hypothetical protein tinsulaeT_25640 [Thalassotalea insulae]
MKFKLELWVSLTAMITAVAAVVVAIIQTQVMHEEAELERQHSRLSVKPSLLLYSNSHVGDKGGSFSFGIENQGLGPAVLQGFSVKLKGKMLNNWFDFFKQATSGQVFLRGEQRNVPDITENRMLNGVIVPAGKGLLLIKLGTNAEVAQQLRLSDASAEISLCYCSFYDECWLTTNNSVTQQSVNSCSVLNAPEFLSLDQVD